MVSVDFLFEPVQNVPGILFIDNLSSGDLSRMERNEPALILQSNCLSFVIVDGVFQDGIEIRENLRDIFLEMSDEPDLLRICQTGHNLRDLYFIEKHPLPLPYSLFHRSVDTSGGAGCRAAPRLLIHHSPAARRTRKIKRYKLIDQMFAPSSRAP